MELIPKLFVAFVAAAGLVYLAFSRQTKGSGLRWLPGRKTRQIEVLDRVPLTAQHSLHLVSLRGKWLAIAVSQQGCQLLDSGPEVECKREGLGA
jgi:flagellar biogenesis protein FliO